MRTQSLTALTLANFAAALPSPQTPDKPIQFFVSIYEKSLTCDASTGAKSVFGNGCVNHVLPSNSSASVNISTVGNVVSGYSEADCKGDVVVVFAASDECTKFETEGVKSWMAGMPAGTS